MYCRTFCKPPVVNSGKKLHCRANVGNIRLRGGLTYWNSLYTTIKIQEYVAKRIGNNTHNKRPIVWGKTSQDVANSPAAPRYKQQTVGALCSVPPNIQRKGNSNFRPVAGDDCNVPEKFFCVPNFAVQKVKACRPIVSTCENNLEFYLVDLQ